MAVEEEKDSSQDGEMKYEEAWQMNWHAILSVTQNRMQWRDLIYTVMENRK